MLKAWFFSPEHCKNLYPTLEEQGIISQKTGINREQLMNWFKNTRPKWFLNALSKIRKCKRQDEENIVAAVKERHERNPDDCDVMIIEMEE
jgi:hypothetical protein